MAAAEALGATASPLLAGFAVALLGLTVSERQDLELPSVALALLVLAAVFLVVSTQVYISGRQYQISRDELRRYAPSLSDSALESAHDRANALYRSRMTRSRWTFNVGIFFLLAGVTGVLLPKDPSGSEWIAPGIGAIALAAEAIWLLRGEWNAARFNKTVQRGREAPQQTPNAQA